MKAFKEFISSYPSKKYPKGALILCEGEIPSSAYVVKRGVVKGYAITGDGTEKPINFIKQQGVFPMGWVFGKLRWSQYYYGAHTNCEVYSIRPEEYVKYLKTRPQSIFEIFEYMVDQHINLQMRVNALEQSKAIDKIIHTLHFLSLCWGREIEPNTVRIILPLTQQDLANIMGLTRETTGIELKKLEQQGIIAYKRRSYLVCIDKLSKVLDEDYTRGQI